MFHEKKKLILNFFYFADLEKKMMRAPRLSIVAQFDDLRRNEQILTQGIETGIKSSFKFSYVISVSYVKNLWYLL